VSVHIGPVELVAAVRSVRAGTFGFSASSQSLCSRQQCSYTVSRRGLVHGVSHLTGAPNRVRGTHPSLSCAYIDKKLHVASEALVHHLAVHVHLQIVQ